MALMPAAYRRARVWAAYHVQVEVETVSIESTPGDALIRAHVRRVFRGRAALRADDLIHFSVAVYSEGDFIPCGGALWNNRPALERARFMEVFLNGRPPDCELALWQSTIIENLTDVPQMAAQSRIADAWQVLRSVLDEVKSWRP